MSDVSAYLHTKPHPPEEPDPRPGRYYVSVRDGSQHSLLAGPFLTHVQALEWVDPVKILAHQLDVRAVWYAYGTCRLNDDVSDRGPGRLNERLGLILPSEKKDRTG